MRKSAALLMGLLIVAIILLMAVSLGYNTLKTLSSGINVSNSEIAKQAAETGLENALIGLDAYTPDQLRQGTNGIAEITRLIMAGYEGSTLVTPSVVPKNLGDPIYIRRDMTEVGLGSCYGASPPNPCDHGKIRTNISTDTNANHQYWNYKIWQEENTQTPVSQNWPNPTGFFSNYVYGPTEHIVGQLNARSPACYNSVGVDPLGECVNSLGYSTSGSKYSFNLYVKGVYTDAVPISPPTGSVTLNVWAWSDPCSVPIFYDPFPSDPSNPSYPKMCGKHSEQLSMISIVIPWSDFLTGTNNHLSVNTGDTAFLNYSHVYYYIDVNTSNFGTGDKLRTTNLISVGKSTYKYPSDVYTIEVIGMYGMSKVKIVALLDPRGDKPKLWRLNIE